MQLHTHMKNTFLSIVILLASTAAFSATTQTVRTSSKITEYFTKKGSSAGLKFDRTVIEVGNRFEDQDPNEKSAQTKIFTLKNLLTRNTHLSLVKSNAEKMGSFSIENIDETRYSDKHCTTTPKEKVCHSSIDLEMTVLPEL